ncbi:MULTISPECIES: hypothetical protein [Pseudomonas]|uniref:hypothetical protein n=1 Tax=Pseudomonas TaxID=286 RepID=UPI000A1D6843|nr:MULTISPECIES: hypothetical protein [Pseudomonas]MCX4219264.1 hypothetical protein [Pseudomonas sp. MCal1]UDI92541.1 hypothetical protein I5961_26130 [Pseudomonas sp. IAC-BECa141]UIN56077.1 hypothetical protein LXN51_07040 [Pseudomonas kribbensis]
MAKYVVLPGVTLYYSDAVQHPLKSPFGVNMKDPQNVVYQIHGLPYASYQRLSGISIKLPANTPMAGDLSLYIDNVTMEKYIQTIIKTLRTIFHSTAARLNRYARMKLNSLGAINHGTTDIHSDFSYNVFLFGLYNSCRKNYRH